MAELLDFQGSFDVDTVGEEEERLRESLQYGIKQNPTAAAQTRKSSELLDIPLSIAVEQPDEINKIAAEKEIHQKVRDAPGTKRFLSNPDNAALAHDDVDTLLKTEKTIGGTWESLKNSFMSASYGLAQIPYKIPEGIARIADYFERIDKSLPGTGLLGAVRGAQRQLYGPEGLFPQEDINVEGTYAENIIKGLKVGEKVYGPHQAAERLERTAQILYPEVEKANQIGDAAFDELLSGNPEPFYENVLKDPRVMASFIGQAIPSLAAMMATGGRAEAIAILEWSEVVSDAAQFEEMTGQKVDPEKFMAASIQATTLNTIAEKFSLKKIFGARGLFGALGAALAEMSTEMFQAFNTNVSVWLTYNEDKDLTGGVLPGGIGGFGAGFGGGVVSSMARKDSPRAKLETGAVKAQNALNAAEALDALAEVVSESTTRERSPSVFRAYLEDQLGIENSVYMDPEDAEAFFQSHPEVLEALPNDTRESIQEALEVGLSVSIPKADYLTSFTDFHEELKDNLRNDIDGYTRAEALEWGDTASEAFDTDFEQTISDVDLESEIAESAARVQTDIEAKLTQIGEAPEIARQEAALQMEFYTTLAHKMRMTPEEMYKRFPVNFQRQALQGVEGLTQLEQTEYQQAIAKGLPMDTDSRMARAKEMGYDIENIMYHGTSADITEFTNRPFGVSKDWAIFFTDDAEHAGTYGKGTTYPVYLNIQNPYYPESTDELIQPDVDALRAQGYDGVIGKYLSGNDEVEYRAVFDPSQIRSVNAAFDPDFADSADLLAQGEALYQTVSTRMPTAVSATEDPLETVLTVDYGVALNDKVSLEKNIKTIQQYPNTRKLTGKGARGAEQNAEAFVDYIANNLLWLHDHMPAEMRDRARLWYDGGRKTVEMWADRYGISEMQGAAMIAVLSPQNGWFPNMSQAERIADAVFGLRDFKWDRKMTQTASKLGMDEFMKKAKGKTLGELLEDPAVAARWIRVYDQTHNSRSYRVLTPEGGVADVAKTASGADAVMPWKSYSTIAKAVSILMDGRAENVHHQIGMEHKVRNFYNNLYAPNSPRGFTTIDTHAVAAALLRPLSASSPEVLHAFGGTGAAGSSVTGMNGTYALYLEAYRRAAEQRGILPRQMQSITWEAVRGLFEAAKKSGLKDQANKIWERYKKGEIEQDQAQAEVLELAGDITPPEWTAAPFNDQPSETYDRADQIKIKAEVKPGAKTTLMFEVAPDPNDVELTAEWNALSPETQLSISQNVASVIVPEILQEVGSDGIFDMQLGGYEGATNPSMALTLDRPQEAITAAKLLGHALSQDSMMVVTEEAIVGAEEVGAVTIELPEGWGETQVEELYDRLWELERDGEKLVGGHSTAGDQMVILNYSPVTTEELGAIIDEHLGGEFTVTGDVVYSAFPSKEEYGYVQDESQRDTTARQPSVQRRPDRFRRQATDLLRQELEAQKTGQESLAQLKRGQIQFTPEGSLITLLENADLSTFLHESGHHFFEVYKTLALENDAIRADMDTLLQFIGVPDLNTWNNMTLEQRRAGHEKVAQAFERYLFEGKAPSLEMQSLFDTFKSWLLQVYKSLTSFNVPLTDDVRQVFDRMLAAEEMIRSKEVADNYQAMFRDQDEAGLTEKQWQEYQNLDEAQRRASVSALERRSLNDLKWVNNKIAALVRASERDIQDKRKAMKEDVTLELETSPVYRAINFVKTGEFTDLDGNPQKIAKHKLDRDDFKRLFPNYDLPRGWTVAGGIPIDEMLAQQFGYETGPEMVKAMLNAAPLKEQIERTTDQRMLEAYGDLMDPVKIHQAAEEAVHSDAHTRMLHTELNALSKRTGVKNLLHKAAKALAERTIGEKKINRIKSWEYSRQEKRAARESERAHRKGDRESAAEHKRAQILANHFWRAARNAEKNSESAIKYLRKFDKPGTRKNLDREFLDQIDQALEHVGLRPKDAAPKRKRVPFADWVEQYKGGGIISEPGFMDQLKTQWSEMTYEELMGLRDHIKNLEHVARHKQKILIAGKIEDYESNMNAGHSEALNVNQQKTDPEDATPKKFEQPTSLWRQGSAWLMKIEFLAELLDGNKPMGRWWNMLFRPIADAEETENKMLEELHPILTEIFNSNTFKHLGQKIFINNKAGHYDRNMVLSMALNTGNSYNLDAMIAGFEGKNQQISHEDVTRILNENLTVEDWKTVQRIWNLIDSYWPQIEELQYRLTGVRPEKVLAEPFTTASGVVMEGGYFPLVFDTKMSRKAFQRDQKLNTVELLETNFLTPTTRQGHVKARTDSNGQFVKLDLGVITQHLNNVIHDLAFREALLSVDKVIQDARTEDAVTRITSREMYNELRPWLAAVAKPNQTMMNLGERIAKGLRKNATIVSMGFKFTTAWMQPLGLTQSMDLLGTGVVMKEAGRFFTTEGREMWKEATKKSAFMRSRQQSFDRDINDALKKLKGEKGPIKRMQEAAFAHIGFMDMMVSVPTWHAGYNKAISEGASEVDAIAMGDRAVRMSQSSGSAKDLSRFQQGNEYQKLYGMFYTYFNGYHNMVRRRLAIEGRKPWSFKKVMNHSLSFLYLSAIPAVLAEMMVGRGPDDDDDEAWAAWAAKEALKYPFMGIPFVRDAMSAATTDFGYNITPVAEGIEDIVNLATVPADFWEGEADEATAKAIFMGSGYLFGLPARQMWTIIDNSIALSEGEELSISEMTMLREVRE